MAAAQLIAQKTTVREEWGPWFDSQQWNLPRLFWITSSPFFVIISIVKSTCVTQGIEQRIIYIIIIISSMGMNCCYLMPQSDFSLPALQNRWDMKAIGDAISIRCCDGSCSPTIGSIRPAWRWREGKELSRLARRKEIKSEEENKNSFNPSCYIPFSMGV